MSILENIRFGKNDVTKDEVIIASKKACAFDFIIDLPNKFDTVVGENGVQLSTGQKQKIALARVLVKNPSILVLDDATSALDNGNEVEVQESFTISQIFYILIFKVQDSLATLTGKTKIVITNKLSSIKQVDKIIVMNKGRVEEVGVHSQLMEKHGAYFNLYTRYQKFYKAAEKDLKLDSISEAAENEDCDQSENDDDISVNVLESPATHVNDSELVSPDDVIKEIAEDKKETVKYDFKLLLKYSYSS